MGDFFGWDLIYKLSENELKKKEDVLTLFAHYILVKGGYKCIGLGDEKALTGNEVSSETLPVEWNNSSTYSIRYVLNNNLFILKGIPVDNNIVYNLLNLGVFPSQRNHEFPYAFNIRQYFVINNTGPDMKVTNVAFHTDSVVAALKGELSTLIPTHEEVLKRIQSDLLAPMGNGTTKEATTQATATESRPVVQSHPSRSGYEFPDPDHPSRPWPPYNPDRDPLLIGRSDLDPLARGGGMIFNPFGRNPPGFPDPSSGLPGPRLPRGAVPPGARFDPFGPVIPNPLPPRRPPDSDDFHPPGFGGMFM